MDRQAALGAYIQAIMPEREAYELVKYQCLNSPFMPGAAEALRDAAIDLVKQLKEDSQ